jgi:hypothetical protein
MMNIVEWLRAYANRKTIIDLTRFNDAAARIEQLEGENASLASWQCEFTDGKTGLVYGDGGSTYCAMAKRVQQLEANKSEQVLELKYHIDQQHAEIVRFRSRIKKLKAALREIGDHNRFGWTMQTEIARAALEGKHD